MTFRFLKWNIDATLCLWPLKCFKVNCLSFSSSFVWVTVSRMRCTQMPPLYYVTFTTYCVIEGRKGKKSTLINAVKNSRQRESHPWVTGFMFETSLTWTDRDLLERTQGLIVPSHPYFLVVNETFSDRKPCRLRGKCWNKKVHCHPSAQTQRKKEVYQESRVLLLLLLLLLLKQQ